MPRFRRVVAVGLVLAVAGGVFLSMTGGALVVQLDLAGHQVEVTVGGNGSGSTESWLDSANLSKPSVDFAFDGDGLNQSVEAGLGTDPRKRDTDGDLLSDGEEARNQAQSGAELSNSDPLRKDLYVVLLVGQGVEPNSQSERAELERAFATMNVSNPGEPGIAVHVVVRRLDHRVIVTNRSDAEATLREGHESLAPARQCVYHSVVVGTVQNESFQGLGSSPGFGALADGSERFDRGGRSVFVRTLVHELLHNLVGSIDGQAHSDTGWLSHSNSKTAENARLSDAVARKLGSEGFQESEYYEVEIC